MYDSVMARNCFTVNYYHNGTGENSQKFGFTYTLRGASALNVQICWPC